MKRFSSAFAFAAMALLAPLHPLAAQAPAQNNGANADQNTKRRLSFPLWKAELPGGTYVIARNSINAVSSQQYVLDGVARVTEVNISTAGVFQPRFYYLEMLPVTVPGAVPGAQLAADHAQSVAKEAATIVDPNVWSKVVKNYPTTTHAGTIEFRLASAKQLRKLYESVERVWLTGESEIYTPEGVRPYDPNKEIKNANDDSKDGESDGGPGSESSGTN